MKLPRITFSASTCLGLAGALLLLAPAVASAGPPESSTISGALFADSFTWDGFVTYWRAYVNRTDRVIQVVSLVMIAALFIITRGKWRK